MAADIRPSVLLYSSCSGHIHSRPAASLYPGAACHCRVVYGFSAAPASGAQAVEAIRLAGAWSVLRDYAGAAAACRDNDAVMNFLTSRLASINLLSLFNYFF